MRSKEAKSRDIVNSLPAPLLDQGPCATMCAAAGYYFPTRSALSFSRAPEQVPGRVPGRRLRGSRHSKQLTPSITLSLLNDFVPPRNTTPQRRFSSKLTITTPITPVTVHGAVKGANSGSEIDPG